MTAMFREPRPARSAWAAEEGEEEVVQWWSSAEWSSAEWSWAEWSSAEEMGG